MAPRPSVSNSVARSAFFLPVVSITGADTNRLETGFCAIDLCGGRDSRKTVSRVSWPDFAAVSRRVRPFDMEKVNMMPRIDDTAHSGPHIPAATHPLSECFILDAVFTDSESRNDIARLEPA